MTQVFAQKVGETIAPRSNESDEEAQEILDDFNQISSGRSVFETHWQETAGETFGERHEIGRHTSLLHRPHRAGASEAVEHFIGDNEHVM